MNDFDGLFTSDYGFKPQGKAAPMAAARSSSVNSAATRSTPGYSNFLDKDDPILNSSRGGKSQGLGSMDGFGDVFGGPPKYSSTPDNRRRGEEFDFDNMFGGQPADTKGYGPVFDKPVYDDEENVFAAEPGLKGSSSNNFENVFASIASPQNGSASSPFDDLLDGIGGNVGGSSRSSNSFKKEDADSVMKAAGDFDDLLPGFGGSSPASARHTTGSATKKSSLVKEDPFSGVDSPLAQEGLDSVKYMDPLEEIGKLGKNGNTMVDDSPVGLFDVEHPFDRHGKERSFSRTGSSTSERHAFRSEKSPEKFSADSPGSSRKKAAPQNNTSDSYQSMFGMPSDTNTSHFHGGQSGPPPSYEESVPSDINSPSTATFHDTESPDDIWLTVSEIPLFTQPTSAPPPSRPPPPRPARARKTETGARSSKNNITDFPPAYNSTQNSQSFKSGTAAARSSVDELEDFANSKAYTHSSAHTNAFDEDSQAQSDAAASAAAMKEVMNRAEAKFRHAKELKERENARVSRNRENNTSKDDVENLDRELKRKEEEEREKQTFELERMKARELEREEKEREQRRLEREKERAREEREKARQAVERATREARERAAADARIRAEKAAVEKANSEARERAERLAVQRAQAEARERAAAEAKERAEKAAAEARARSNAEAKERTAKAENEARVRAERAAVERAAREARERAAAQAREKAAAQARERDAATRANQQKPEDDLEFFFGSGSRPSSAPRASANNSDSLFNSQFQTKQGTETARRTSSSSSSIRKASSTTNIVDDLSSIFGGSPQPGSFQEVEGETEERRRSRLERHQRTNERAAKALAEKNERDLQAQREQAERHRLSETLDAEIKRWAAGKEGNLRALISTMQYILWPECGWQPVSLTDLITGAAVKKAYRKATLCIHPDKVQQKGANLQQKYIAEKVFDLLKEAWNKFNSEELF
ncbi:unnamed protein product [Rhodiola kirilowii]